MSSFLEDLKKMRQEAIKNEIKRCKEELIKSVKKNPSQIFHLIPCEFLDSSTFIVAKILKEELGLETCESNQSENGKLIRKYIQIRVPPLENITSS